ncbi:MAG: hypothetical protein JWM16_44 [Verrucomicrobiales bacterium]|nr:hypothetical protein [Verrucomicrobiales bacterium]
MIRRPKTLHELAEESLTYEDFGMNMRDFLHEFAFAKKNSQLLSRMLEVEPPRMAGRLPEGKICDAFLAATADYLSRENHLDTPRWARKDDFMLEEPWFSPETIGVRALLLRDTPSAFKDKNIFIFPNALNVA